ncbi:hypothetical protein EIN_259490 [Entamoeba invadens IP1]|uniref:Uncharacterized protein n=1 Tax=Entamoeba invadens IP1 TaxID=370355 RepID=A0A0A1TXG7_ENTIV|nr:hypothetical protein EIN_259490 [Entamoeba invadens IP1]ELP84205.1 hypothetical protein EIN_259490 [Entamoeba invadens IP1]|eukprot:XP_004183551.1 hypothetical protein EIN_259490 [Entamoeba invadens IP1]
MKQLESVFLKNVILYLQTSSDICSFILINKKCCDSIQSMYTASYNLCRNTPLPKIQRYFPNIQTIYLEATTLETANVGPRFKPYIDLDASECVLKNRANCLLAKSLNNISDYAKKIRKLKIEANMLDIIADYTEKFVELKTLVINYLRQCTFLDEVLSIRTLRDVTIYFNQNAAHELADFDFQKYSNISFTFVLQNASQPTSKNQIDSAKRLSQKYPLYVQMITKESIDMKFIPDIQMAFSSFEERLTLSISSDMSGKEDFIEEMMKKCECSRLDISPPGTSEELGLFRPKGIATFDFLESEIIKEVVLRYVNCKDVVLPRKCRAFEIYNCEGKICAEQCKPEEVYIDLFECESITINEDNLKRVQINANISECDFVCNGQSGIPIVDFMKLEYVNFFCNENTDIGLMCGDTRISKICVGGLKLDHKKLEIINCTSEVILNGIDLEEVTFSNWTKANPISATVGDVKKVYVCGGLLKVLQIGKCDEIKVSSNATIKLLKKTKQKANLVKEDNSKVTKIEIMEELNSIQFIDKTLNLLFTTNESIFKTRHFERECCLKMSVIYLIIKNSTFGNDLLMKLDCLTNKILLFDVVKVAKSKCCQNNILTTSICFTPQRLSQTTLYKTF